MRFTKASLHSIIAPLLLHCGCQDPGPATTDATSGTGVTTGEEPSSGTPVPGSTAEEPTTDGSVTSSAPDPTSSTTASESSSTGTTSSPTEPIDPDTSSTTGDPVDTTTTSSTSLDTTTEDGGSSTTDPDPPPQCFPRQVPWAQPCQAAVDGVETLATIPTSAYGIAVDETHVYFTDYSSPGAPELHRVSKCGGAVETLSSAGANPCRIKMDHNVVYVSELVDSGAIYRVSKLDGTLGVVTSNLGQSCSSVIVMDDAILFSGHEQPGIWKASKFWGGPPELAFDTGEKHPGWIDTDGVYVYWNQTWDSPVERFSLAGGPSEFVTDALGSYPFEVSCEHVYGNRPNAPGFWRVPVTGGPPEKVALEAAHRSTMGDTHMYFTAAGTHEIYEVPLDGGAPALVADIGNPGLLAVDATHVFWSDPDSAVIRMAPRPKI